VPSASTPKGHPPFRSNNQGRDEDVRRATRRAGHIANHGNAVRGSQQSSDESLRSVQSFAAVVVDHARVVLLDTIAPPFVRRTVTEAMLRDANDDAPRRTLPTRPLRHPQNRIPPEVDETRGVYHLSRLLQRRFAGLQELAEARRTCARE